MSVSNDQIYAAILALKEDVGGLKAAAINIHEYTGAVNGKINSHIEDQNAHGAGGANKVWERMLLWAGVGLAAIEIGLGIHQRR